MIKLNQLSSKESDLFFPLEDKIWPEKIRATREQLEYRLEVFPEGIFGIWVNNSPIGFATSQIIEFNRDMNCKELEKYLPRFGEFNIHHNKNGNCLHFMSAGILNEFRGNNYWDLLIHARICLAQYLHLEYIIVDLRIPFYQRLKSFYSYNSINDYIKLKKENFFIDPYMKKFQKIGFNFAGIVNSSYSDDECDNTWIYMQKKLR